MFRLFLGAVGLAAFLMVKHFAATDPPDVLEERQPGAAPISILSPADPKAQVLVPAASLPAITHLETQHRSITIKAGERGPVYDVKTSDGGVMALGLSEDELRTQDPGLYELIQSAVADASLQKQRLLDARVRMDGRLR